MALRSTKLLLLWAILFSPFSMSGLVGETNRVWAQPPAGSENREERRERWRRFGDGERGRSSRGESRGEGGDSRRGERRDGSSSTSSDTSRTSSNSTSSSASSSSPPTSASSSSASKPAATSSSSSSGSMAMTDYAKSLVKQYDKNGDNMLQPDERKELRGRAAESDLNKDGVITIDELVAHLSSSSPSPASGSTPATSTSAANSSASSSGSSSSTSPSSASRGGNDSSKLSGEATKRVFYGSTGGMAANTKEGDKRRTYRFTTATERLPTGLPSWFTSKDTNHDGQVQMSEYSRYWSKSIVEEFRRYDLNDDGFITAKEAAKK